MYTTIIITFFWWCMFHWQIFKESVQWETSSRIESLQNAKHVPGGGNVKVGSEFSFCVPVRPFREQQTVNVGIEGFNLFTRIFWRKFRWWKWWLLFGRWAGWKALSVFDYLFCTTWSNYNTSQLFLLYLHTCTMVALDQNHTSKPDRVINFRKIGIA